LHGQTIVPHYGIVPASGGIAVDTQADESGNPLDCFIKEPG
jgi:hypothetical protein